MKKRIDYVLYVDTDSCYIHVNDFCINHFGKEWWESRSNDEKIDIIDELSDYIKDYINERTFDEIQKITYNSSVDDFKINFEKEKIGISGLFVKKKKYAVRALWVEGERKEKISVTGLDIVRSDSSEAVRSRLKDVMNMILKDVSDEEIADTIHTYKKELLKVYPEEIAANIGIKNLKKYIKDGKAIKGTPWHVKGAANYHMLLNDMNLKGKYEEISEGTKCKVSYLKDNSYGIDIVSFLRWPVEFEKYIQPDYDKMIDKFFIKKIEMLLAPMNKTDILNKTSKKVMNLFFK
jgi:DNA polymerase elongation subunit (family B)